MSNRVQPKAQVHTELARPAQSGWKRTVLVEDERGRGIPAVVGYGPHVFVAGSDGHRRLDDNRIDASLTDKAAQQCANAYGRIARRLEQAGYSGECTVAVQNFTSGQHWRAERMNRWPDYFGEENHRRTVSFGAQARMSGINMLSAIAWAVDPCVPREVAVPSPARGRASRITRVGDLTFVIGVRGYVDPVSGAPVAEEREGSFEAQFDCCFETLRAHLQADGSKLGKFVRVDAAVRAARYAPQFDEAVRRAFNGRVPFGLYAVGMPLGARGEMEVGGIAVSPGAEKTIHWSRADPTCADVTIGGGLAFVRNVSGARDEVLNIVAPYPGDLASQVRRAVRNIEMLLRGAELGMDGLLRFDVFVRDIYAEEEVLRELSSMLGHAMPAVSVIGAEPRHHAELEITAVAACPT